VRDGLSDNDQGATRVEVSVMEQVAVLGTMQELRPGWRRRTDAGGDWHTNRDEWWRVGRLYIAESGPVRRGA
jgi:hypothetical protein